MELASLSSSFIFSCTFTDYFINQYLGPSIYYVGITFDFFLTRYVSRNTVLNVSKTGNFLDPSSTFADVIYGWSLKVHEKTKEDVSDANSNTLSLVLLMWKSKTFFSATRRTY